MARSQVAGASLLPSFPHTLAGKGYCAKLRHRMVPRYCRASTFGTAANALAGSATPQFSKMRSDCHCHANDVSARLSEPLIQSVQEWNDSQPDPLRDGEVGGMLLGKASRMHGVETLSSCSTDVSYRPGWSPHVFACCDRAAKKSRSILRLRRIT
jgi:hypothetical protein